MITPEDRSAHTWLHSIAQVYQIWLKNWFKILTFWKAKYQHMFDLKGHIVLDWKDMILDTCEQVKLITVGGIQGHIYWQDVFQ